MCTCHRYNFPSSNIWSWLWINKKRTKNGKTRHPTFSGGFLLGVALQWSGELLTGVAGPPPIQALLSFAHQFASPGPVSVRMHFCGTWCRPWEHLETEVSSLGWCLSGKPEHNWWSEASPLESPKQLAMLYEYTPHGCTASWPPHEVTKDSNTLFGSCRGRLTKVQRWPEKPSSGSYSHKAESSCFAHWLKPW